MIDGSAAGGAVRETAGVITAFDLAGQPAMSFRAQVIQLVSLMSPRTPRSNFRPAPEMVS